MKDFQLRFGEGKTLGEALAALEHGIKMQWLESKTKEPCNLKQICIHSEMRRTSSIATPANPQGIEMFVYAIGYLEFESEVEVQVQEDPYDPHAHAPGR